MLIEEHQGGRDRLFLILIFGLWRSEQVYWYENFPGNHYGQYMAYGSGAGHRHRHRSVSPRKGEGHRSDGKSTESGEVFMAKSWEENLCRNEDCPLFATVVLIRDAEVKALQAAARLKRYETSRKHSRDVFFIGKN
jgi:hypothetical protein